MDPVRRQIDTAGLAAFVSLPWSQLALVDQERHQEGVPGFTCVYRSDLPGSAKRFLKPLPVNIAIREGPRGRELVPPHQDVLW